MLFTETWMQLEIITLGHLRQSQRQPTLSPFCGSRLERSVNPVYDMKAQEQLLRDGGGRRGRNEDKRISSTYILYKNFKYI